MPRLKRHSPSSLPTAPPDIASLARLRAAKAPRRTPKPCGPADDAIANGSPSVNQRRCSELAAVRAALLLVDTAPPAEMTKRLEPLTAAGSAFRHTARELLALTSVKAGDPASAKKWIDMILADR